MDNDTDLYARLQAGDPQALNLLVERYHRLLFSFIFRLTDDSTLADDLTQQTFIRILSYQGAPPAHMKAWIVTIARNLVYDYFRSARFRREQDSDFANLLETASSETDPSPEEMTILADQQQAIAALLQRLPTEQREVVILRFYHEMALQEIADVIGVPLGTTKSRLFHALKKLRYHMAEIGQHDE